MTALLHRRRCLTLAAAAGGATLFDLPRLLQAAGLVDAQDPFGGFPIGVQSYSLREFNTAEAVRHIQGMGLHYAEFYSKHLPLDASEAQLAETRRLLADAKVTLNAHGVNRFTADHEANRKVFDFAKRAGIRNITADPTADSFESLDRLVAEYDIRVAIHNHGPGHRYNKIQDVVDAVQGHHKWIGACVDTGHFIRAGEDPVQAVRQLGARVFGLHLKDDTERGTGSHNVVLGKAHLDVVGLFRALREIKFPADGALSLEYEANPANPIDDMRACVAVIREAIGKLS